MHGANMKILEKLFTLPTEHEVNRSEVQSGLFRSPCREINYEPLRPAHSLIVAPPTAMFQLI